MACFVLSQFLIYVAALTSLEVVFVESSEQHLPISQVMKPIENDLKKLKNESGLGLESLCMYVDHIPKTLAHKIHKSATSFKFINVLEKGNTLVYSALIINKKQSDPAVHWKRDYYINIAAIRNNKLKSFDIVSYKRVSTQDSDVFLGFNITDTVNQWTEGVYPNLGLAVLVTERRASLTGVVDAKSFGLGSVHSNQYYFLELFKKKNGKDCSLGYCDVPIDLGVAVDSSGGIYTLDWWKEKLLKLVDSFDVSINGTHIAVINFNRDASIITNFDETNPAVIRKRIKQMRRGRKLSYIDKALAMANKKVFSNNAFMRKGQDVLKVLIVMSDGKQTAHDKAKGLAVASRPLKDKGVHVFTVGIGSSINQRSLRQIASSPCYVYKDSNVQQLIDTIQKLRQKLCSSSAPHHRYFFQDKDLNSILSR